MYVNHNKLTDWTPDKVLFMLETSDAWVENAILALYRRQTDLEQRAGSTIDDNDKGFQQGDAKLFGQYARKIMSGQHLSSEEMSEVRRPWRRGKTPVITIGKYRKQLVRMIEEKAKAAIQLERL
jgi:hypothetical protein